MLVWERARSEECVYHDSRYYHDDIGIDVVRAWLINVSIIQHHTRVVDCEHTEQQSDKTTSQHAARLCCRMKRSKCGSQGRMFLYLFLFLFSTLWPSLRLYSSLHSCCCKVCTKWKKSEKSLSFTMWTLFYMLTIDHGLYREADLLSSPL